MCIIKLHTNQLYLICLCVFSVVHLVTAASGAERAYTNANNQARAESAQLARELDEKIKAVRGAYIYFLSHFILVRSCLCYTGVFCRRGVAIHISMWSITGTRDRSRTKCSD